MLPFSLDSRKKVTLTNKLKKKKMLKHAKGQSGSKL